MKQLGAYELGATAFFACQADARFSRCLYVPKSYDERKGTDRPLLIAVHGSGRVAESYRNAFRDFAEHHDVIVLAPLFPCGVGDPEDQSGYKFLHLDEIRFDRVLLAMIEQVRRRYAVRARRVLLFGYSGGGQFAHRFFYCHPESLLAVSIGAPGVVTLLDEDRPWWLGVGGLGKAMGCEPDYDAMRAVPVQLVIGANDIDDAEITMRPDHRYYLPGINDTGRNRQERLAALAGSLMKAGIRVRQDVVPGEAHDGYAVIGQVTRYIGEVLDSCNPSR